MSDGLSFAVFKHSHSTVTKRGFRQTTSRSDKSIHTRILRLFWLLSNCRHQIHKLFNRLTNYITAVTWFSRQGSGAAGQGSSSCYLPQSTLVGLPEKNFELSPSETLQMAFPRFLSMKLELAKPNSLKLKHCLGKLY